MRSIVIVILLISLHQEACGQSFLNDYKRFRLEKTRTIPNSKKKKEIKRFVKSQIVELDTIFKSYKAKTNFDFNTADTLFLIYDSPDESPFTSDIIIWSGNDTISYVQGFERIKPFKFKRTVAYTPFTYKTESPRGFRIVTERDSLLTLVSKRDFETINHLGDHQSISDGCHISIYVAYKDGRQYKFETCFPKKFTIPEVYIKD